MPYAPHPTPSLAFNRAIQPVHSSCWICPQFLSLPAGFSVVNSIDMPTQLALASRPQLREVESSTLAERSESHETR